MFTFFKILGPEPAFCRLGLGGSLGGYSSHGYTHASHRVDSTQLGGNRLFFKFCPPQSANRGPLRSKTVTNVGPKQAFRCLDFSNSMKNWFCTITQHWKSIHVCQMVKLLWCQISILVPNCWVQKFPSTDMKYKLVWGPCMGRWKWSAAKMDHMSHCLRSGLVWKSLSLYTS